MKFALVFLIAALGIPAFMMVFAHGLSKGAREGLSLADATAGNDEAKAVLHRYSSRILLFFYIFLAGMIVRLCGDLKMMASGHFPGVCQISLVLVIVGWVGICWFTRARNRELARMNIHSTPEIVY